MSISERRTLADEQIERERRAPPPAPAAPRPSASFPDVSSARRGQGGGEESPGRTPTPVPRLRKPPRKASESLRAVQGGLRDESPLTARQAAFLRYVMTYFVKHAHMPSYRDIGDHFGIASVNAVAGCLAILIEKGYLEYDPGSARTLRLVGAVVKVEYAADAAGERLRKVMEG